MARRILGSGDRPVAEELDLISAPTVTVGMVLGGHIAQHDAEIGSLRHAEAPAWTVTETATTTTMTA